MCLRLRTNSCCSLKQLTLTLCSVVDVFVNVVDSLCSLIPADFYQPARNEAHICATVLLCQTKRTDLFLYLPCSWNKWVQAQNKKTSSSAAAEIVCVRPGHLFFNGFPLSPIFLTSLEQLEVTLGCTCKVFVSSRSCCGCWNKRGAHREANSNKHAQAVDSFLILVHVTWTVCFRNFTCSAPHNKVTPCFTHQIFVCYVMMRQ